MIRKLKLSVLVLGILTPLFHGCAKPPPPPPVSWDQINAVYESAMKSKQQLESVEKQRDLLNAELKEKQNKLQRAKDCADQK